MRKQNDTSWVRTERAQALNRLANLTPRFGLETLPAKQVPEAAFIPQYKEAPDDRTQP